MGRGAGPRWVAGIAAVSCVLAADGPSSCASDVSSPYLCSLLPDNPHESTSAARRGVVEVAGKVRFYCTQVVKSHMLTMTLDYQDTNGDWATKATRSIDTIPNVANDATGATVSDPPVVYDGCITGKWRTGAKGVAVTTDGQTVGTPDVTYKEGDITCR